MTDWLIVPITPMGKPRMTQRDKWAQRACVVRWREYADNLRAMADAVHFTLPDSGAILRFYFPMPETWSLKRRREMIGKPHQQKPDIDNCTKGILDALLEDDRTVWHLEAEKRWANEGSVQICMKAKPRTEITIKPLEK